MRIDELFEGKTFIDLHTREYYERLRGELQAALGIKVRLQSVHIGEYGDTVDYMLDEKVSFSIMCGWKRDGSPSKPVTNLRIGYASMRMGRVPMWNDPAEYADTLLGQNVRSQIKAELEDTDSHYE